MKNLKDINWNHLYYFYEVSKEQSLKKAANKIGLTSATLSSQMRTLEKSFSSKLFHRSSKGLSLTQEGSTLFEKVKIIFEEGSKILEHYTEDTIGGYPVSVGIEETITQSIACEFASQYWDLYTEFGTVNTVRQGSHESLVENILLGNLDWGISLKVPRKKSLNYMEIGSFEIVFCCSEDLFNTFKSPKDILINIPFVENRIDNNLNKIVLQYLRRHRVIPKEKFQSDHHEFVQNLCHRGRCVMYVPINPLENYPGLKIFRLKEPLKVSLYAIWNKKDEELISIRKLKDLLSTKLTNRPDTYSDGQYQIEVSDVANELLE